jgi:hypothetical protein
MNLDRFSIVHCPVPIGDAIETDDLIENAAGLDFPLKHIGQKFLEICAYWRRAAAHCDVAVERRL